MSPKERKAKLQKLLSSTPKRVAWLEIYQPINDALLKSPSRTAKNLSRAVYWPVEEAE